MTTKISKLIRYLKERGIKYWIIIGLLFIGALEGGAVVAKYSSQIANLINPRHTQVNISPTTIPTPIDTNLVACFTKGANVTLTETECLEANGFVIRDTAIPTSRPIAKTTINPDPIVDCNYKYHGVQKIRQSLCSKQFECQIKDKWYFYTDREKCKQDQKAYSGSNSTNYVYPTYAPWPTYAPLPTSALDSYDYQTTEPTVDPAEYQQKKEACINEYNEKVQGIRNQYGSSTGTADFMIQQLTDQYQLCFNM
ncbi:MAG: hypothetical protein WBO77_03975 [Microgenomates group bacterium]